MLESTVYSTLNSQQIVPLRQMLQDGGVIVDVRTPCEFIGGHITGAWNCPAEDLNVYLDIIRKWDKPVIVCSADDRRSFHAARRLKQLGIAAFDGGSWDELQEWIGKNAGLRDLNGH